MNEDQIALLKSRYLDDEESPDEMFERVATCVAGPDGGLNKLAYASIMAQSLFLPNSPTLMNAGRQGGLSACYVIPVEDSMDSIFQAVKEAAIITKAAGGVGIDLSKIRSNGSPVGKHNGIASGPCSFIHNFNQMIDSVKQGGRRRGAMIGILRCDHPEIVDFIKIKEQDGVLSNFNLSVAVTEEFMMAVTGNLDFNLVDPFTKRVTKTLPAREIWDLIIEKSWSNGEPGIIFIDQVNRMNPVPGLGHIAASNPCWTGDTQVWTINGPKTFKELATEGKDIPVLTQDQDGKLVFKTMRQPRLTRKDCSLVCITLDDGTQLKCTPDHKLYLRDGTKIAANELKPNDSIASVYRHKANSKGYLKISNGIESPMEAHVVLSWKAGRRPNYPYEHCHHIDENKTNNFPDNLELVTAREHNASKMRGDRNPGYGKWDESNPLFNRPVNGSSNPNYRHDISNDEIIKLREQGKTLTHIASLYNTDRHIIKKRLIAVNHKVVSVETLTETQDVYNGTVDDTHSFFVICNKGAILSANCGEIPLPPYGSCNLGSINLAKFVTYDPGLGRNVIDYSKLSEVISLAVRFLDNVIDVNHYPLLEIKEESLRSRRIGLGVMGWADMLYQLGIRYSSQESLLLADSLGRFIYDAAHGTSVYLADQKGPYQGYKEGMPYRRNATLLTVAPTGSISLIANCSSGIEPVFSLIHKRKTFEGLEMTLVNKHFENKLDDDYSDDQKRKILDHLIATGHTDGLLTEEDKSIFVSSHDISPQEHVLMQATWQKHIDNSISKTVNLPNSATREEVGEVISMAWQKGCKGVTVYRDGSRANQVLTKVQDIHPKQRPNTVSGTTEKVSTGCGSMYVTVNQQDNKPFEAFAILGRSGSCNKAMTEGLARLVSLCLRSGVALDDIIKQLSGLRCQSPTMGPAGCSSCPDGIAKALARSSDITIETKTHAGQCPECGEILIMQEGCAYCRCGYGKCS